jgi:hypothetical protein
VLIPGGEQRGEQYPRWATFTPMVKLFFNKKTDPDWTNFRPLGVCFLWELNKKFHGFCINFDKKGLRHILGVFCKSSSCHPDWNNNI